MDKPLLFLLKLAWASRYRIPAIITVAFMALDIRMHLDINIQMRTMQRRPGVALQQDDTFSDDSWITYDEETDEEEDVLIPAY